MSEIGHFHIVLIAITAAGPPTQPRTDPMMRLRAALAALLAPGRHRVTPEDVEQLADRLGALEEVQAKREADWLEWQERMTRMLQRLAGRAGREKQLADAEDGYAVAKRTALALKFPRAQGGD